MLKNKLGNKMKDVGEFGFYMKQIMEETEEQMNYDPFRSYKISRMNTKKSEGQFKSPKYSSSQNVIINENYSPGIRDKKMSLVADMSKGISMRSILKNSRPMSKTENKFLQTDRVLADEATNNKKISKFESIFNIAEENS